MDVLALVGFVAADLSSADYFAGRDPVLQAILDTPVAPG